MSGEACSVEYSTKRPGSLVLRKYSKDELLCEEGEPGWTAFYILRTEELLAIRQIQLAEAKEKQVKAGSLEKAALDAQVDTWTRSVQALNARLSVCRAADARVAQFIPEAAKKTPAERWAMARDEEARGARDRAILLRETAERIATALRDPDWSMHDGLLARFDGDCFIVMLHWCRLSFTERLAEDLRRRIARASFAQGLRVTVSIAVSAHRRGESIDALLARTERTLHLAKQFGGDRIETARTPAPHGQRALPTSTDFLRV